MADSAARASLRPIRGAPRSLRPNERPEVEFRRHVSGREAAPVLLSRWAHAGVPVGPSCAKALEAESKVHFS